MVMVCWLIGLLSLETSSVGLIVGLSAGLFRNSTNLVGGRVEQNRLPVGLDQDRGMDLTL